MLKKWIEKIEKNCTGCGACINICHTKAISMRENQEGFWYPKIEYKKCVQCGKCAYICPILNCSEFEKLEKVAIYAAWSLNPEVRYCSTSGGIFSELAERILEQGGRVCGAVYDGCQMVHHQIIYDKKDIERLRQSKYVQSDMGNVYYDIGNVLRENRPLLFCGSPCQCWGVYNYCVEKKIRCGNLYLVDFICRGANSPKVYRKFLDELEQAYGAKVSRVWFKNKTYGWNCFSTKIEFENGTSYLQDRYHDIYIRGYIEENLYMRPSCSECKFKGFHRVADITLADFWGITLQKKQKECDGGTSMVMVHTEKGRDLWNSLVPYVYSEEKRIEEVVAGNPCFENSARQGRHREQFMSDLDEMPIMENIKRFLKKND